MRLITAALAACAALLAPPAAAEDTALLIQIETDGRYTVWHAGGKSPLGDEEISALEVTARPEGGKPTLTTAGLAQAFDTPAGMLIRLPALGPDRSLLIDRDGCGDLAVGVPGEDRNGIGDAGIVNVIYGSPAGLTLVGNQIFWQDTAGMQEIAEAGDRFGHALATGERAPGWPLTSLVALVPRQDDAR